MEATLKREDLVRGLHLVQGVVERRSTLPILLNVHIEPCEEGVALTATDTEVGLRVRVRAQTTRKAAITLSARKLYEIIRELTTPEVTIRAATAGWVEVHAGRSKFKVVSMDAKDFPAVSLAMLDGLADGVRGQFRSPRGSEQTIRAVLARLFTVEGFHGNSADYYDPRNSFLNDVLERRTGIPITLALV